ncbi:sporulation protein [Natrinema sp. 1APR25-10V2]|uniref:sporulation protein n=1 Tax=Natrinema sp. 1APR25-10V2 TaxID=2951081 RepID=UPI002876E382|nr:sporulation protein [Natrinema sp. 1APR25-10V2]MDS0473927.1 sporulation protein [Natrinema sp. 1APR25-10V2]
MKRILSSLGIGSATVDTVLPTTLTAGESVDARVDVTGGNDTQEVDGIYFALATRYETDESRGAAKIETYDLADSFTIEPDEERSFTVTIDVPYHTPVTHGRTNVWLDTGLDIDWAVDPDDRDPIEIEPDPLRESLFDALESLGFTLRTAKCEATESLFANRRFVQELEFVPRSGPFAGDLDELEVVTLPEGDGFDLLLEVDRSGGLLAEHFDADERYDRVSLQPGDEADLERRLRAAIERNL